MNFSSKENKMPQVLVVQGLQYLILAKNKEPYFPKNCFTNEKVSLSDDFANDPEIII
jgi:hypothetical protein